MSQSRLQLRVALQRKSPSTSVHRWCAPPLNHRWRSDAEGGMLSVLGFVSIVWPITVDARTPTATTSDEGQPHAPHSPKGHDTSETGSESASCTRGRHEQPDHVNDRPVRPPQGKRRGGPGGTGICSQVQRGRGSSKKKSSLTTITIPKQVSLLSVCFLGLWCSDHAPRSCPLPARSRRFHVGVERAILRSRRVHRAHGVFLPTIGRGGLI